MRVLIVGCGYVGTALGTELIRLGHEVSGLTRTEARLSQLQAAGIRPLVADITSAGDLARLRPDFDWVVNTASSSKGGTEEYRAVYQQGTLNLIDWLAATPPKKYVYTSSTSVYGQTDGSLVKESSPAEPGMENGRILRAAEDALLNAARTKAFPAVILRVAGIYGPGRGHLFQQYLKNQAFIMGQGDHLLNMIHRDDVVNSIVAALKYGRAGEIYNAVDDEPVTEIIFYQFLSETLGKRMPPSAPPGNDSARKRALTHKKVSNRRLRMELGCMLRYPTFRQGYTAEIKRLQDAGEI